MPGKQKGGLPNRQPPGPLRVRGTSPGWESWETSIISFQKTVTLFQMTDQHGTGGQTDDMFGDTAHEQPGQPFPTV